MIVGCRAVNPSALNILRPRSAPSPSRSLSRCWSPTQRSFLRFCSTSSISGRQEQREQRRGQPQCQLREGVGELAKKGGILAAAAGDGGESGRMVSYASATLYVVGGIVVVGMALLVAFQERLVYVPVLPGLSKSYAITPSRLRLLYEDVWLRSSDGVRLHAWFIKLYPDCRGPVLNPLLALSFISTPPLF